MESCSDWYASHSIAAFLQSIPLEVDLAEKTMVGAHGAGEALLEHLYEAFTGKK